MNFARTWRRARTSSFASASIFDLRVRERVEVRDIEARHVGALVRPRLPYVVPERLPRGAEDDVRRGVVPHQRLAPLAVDRACDARADERRCVAADEVQHGRPDLLDVVDLAVGDRAVVRLLAAALRVEVRLVQDDRFALDREDLSAEYALPLVLVHAELRRRQRLRDREFLRGLGARGPFVAGRDACIEVVRDIDGHVRELAHDVGVQAVAVV